MAIAEDLSGKSDPKTKKMKAAPRAVRPMAQIHPRVEKVAAMVGAPTAATEYFGITRLRDGLDPRAAKRADWKWMKREDANRVNANRWPMELFSLEWLRSFGGGYFRCWWYQSSNDRPRPGRIFELEGDPVAPEAPVAGDDDDGDRPITRRELLALLESKGAPATTASAPAPAQQSQIQSIRDTISLVAALKEIVAPPAAAPVYPPEVRAVLEQASHEKLAKAVGATVLAELRAAIPVDAGAASDDEEDDEDEDPKFESWSELWDLLSADAKTDVYSLVKDHRSEMKALLPLAIVKLKELVKEAGAELRAQKANGATTNATA
jgi:hypothetical protein